MITDVDFVDDLCLFSDNTEAAQTFLLKVEEQCSKVGLLINEKKTEFMSFNQNSPTIKTLNGSELTRVDDFRYLGSWINDTRKDINNRICLAWTALNKLSMVWKSTLDSVKKTKLFQACVESVLLFGCESWSLTKDLVDKINGSYTRMLRRAKNISWSDFISNKILYSDTGVSRITQRIKKRRMALVGHCYRHKDVVANFDVLWNPVRGKRSRGRPKVTLIDQLKADTGVEDLEEIKKLMQDKSVWKNLQTLNVSDVLD